MRQLKENNLAEDIWFDKDEKNTDSPCWFSMRMEAIEKCRAAILILSDSYFMCPVSVYEGKTLVERLKVDPTSVAIFPVMFSSLEKTEMPKEFNLLVKDVVELTSPDNHKLSLAEKTSVVIGSIMEELEKYASSFPSPANFSVVTGSSAMTSVLPMEKPTAAATAHNLQAPTLKVPHTTANTNGAGKFNSQQSPSGSPSVRKKGTNVSGGNNMSVKPIPVLSVSSFYELSAYLPVGKWTILRNITGK